MWEIKASLVSSSKPQAQRVPFTTSTDFGSDAGAVVVDVEDVILVEVEGLEVLINVGLSLDRLGSLGKT